MKKLTLSQILIIVLAFLLLISIIVLVIAINKNKVLKQVDYMYTVAQDSVTVMRNKDNQQVGKIEVLTSANNDAFTKLVTANADVKRLQTLVANYEKKNGQLITAITVTNQTSILLKDSIENLIIGYTHSKKDTANIYPVYRREFTREWDKGSVIMGLNTLDLSILNKNEYEFTIGNEKVSLFKRKVYANITNLNPNTETKVMKVYQKTNIVNPTFKNILISGGIGTALGIFVGLVLIK